jgi:hypothetical protein
MKACYGTGGIAPRIPDLGTNGGEWIVSRPSRFTPKERIPCTHWIGGWAGPTAGLDTW